MAIAPPMPARWSSAATPTSAVRCRATTGLPASRRLLAGLQAVAQLFTSKDRTISRSIICFLLASFRCRAVPDNCPNQRPAKGLSSVNSNLLWRSIYSFRLGLC